MIYMSKESYEHFKNIIHPNVRTNINHYRDGGTIILPVYHGCGKANRNGTRKRIDYKRGEQCVLPTQKAYWKPFKDIKKKYLHEKVYFTRYIYFTRYMSNLGLNYLAKAKGNLWYDWDEKKNISQRLIGLMAEMLKKLLFDIKENH